MNAMKDALVKAGYKASLNGKDVSPVVSDKALLPRGQVLSLTKELAALWCK